MHTLLLSQRLSTCSSAPQAELQAALLTAVRGLAELVAQLSAQLGAAASASPGPAPEAWCQPRAEPQPDSASGPSSGTSTSRRLGPAWEELSVVELRALLRSYPIDRSSLPAPIELLRRGELVEALSQLQAMSA
ncbi:hypothetical protein [Vulcanococcus limneticus]|uniref:hypothetical protein n=1 Tax=Vulcanococcus limneticus TaxID=2170428 RepID=UPI000B9957EF|nr:hypothetical protein [Vulcanococcus limneticus]MCP9793462.1 hypothetical protein [Vulcanococcus limneticus MW73D5]MCP9898823.1 hypothetical protein [Vulcanococcus limneticus Candia 3B3]